MKSLEKVNEAREIIADHMLKRKDLTQTQKSILMGMLNALVWVADGPNTETLERIIQGMRIKTVQSEAAHQPAYERFDQALYGTKLPDA